MWPLPASRHVLYALRHAHPAVHPVLVHGEHRRRKVGISEGANRACAPKTLPVRRWQARQWQTETRTGSPVTSALSRPQLQEAIRVLMVRTGGRRHPHLRWLGSIAVVGDVVPPNAACAVRSFRLGRKRAQAPCLKRSIRPFPERVSAFPSSGKGRIERQCPAPHLSAIPAERPRTAHAQLRAAQPTSAATSVRAAARGSGCPCRPPGTPRAGRFPGAAAYWS